jgi:hypothetical protein
LLRSKDGCFRSKNLFFSRHYKADFETFDFVQLQKTRKLFYGFQKNTIFLNIVPALSQTISLFQQIDTICIL